MPAARCPFCGKMFNCTDQNLGNRYSCQGCNREFRLPRSADNLQDQLDALAHRETEGGQQDIDRQKMLLILLGVFGGVAVLLSLAFGVLWVFKSIAGN